MPKFKVKHGFKVSEVSSRKVVPDLSVGVSKHCKDFKIKPSKEDIIGYRDDLFNYTK